MKTPDIYLFDLETAPSLGHFFDMWREGNIVSTEQSWYILSFAIKKLGDAKVTTYALPDFKGYKKDPQDDYKLVQKLWEYFDKAEVLIAHNGDNFDIKKSNARFIYHRLTPPRPYKTVDTLKIARRHFKFDSNRLDALAKHLSIGSKLPTTGFDTWKGCMTGDPTAWALMRAYNAQDVELLERVYLTLRPWATNHPNLNIDSRTDSCPKCQSTNLQKRGFQYNMTSEMQRYQCLNCFAWCKGKPVPLDVKIHIR